MHTNRFFYPIHVFIAALLLFAQFDVSHGSDQAIVADGTFEMVSEEQWDETAVRKVLHLFAYGGFTTDKQIQAWANMKPGKAIVQILTFKPFNPSLSPADTYDLLPFHAGTLNSLRSFWSSLSPFNKVPLKSRKYYDRDSSSSLARTWLQAVTKRGLNPVRQKIGLFETNYHLVANLDAGVGSRQIYRYYDDIMNALDRQTPYQDVLATAASSAAIAVQYNHKDNQFINAKFEGNEDFAREYHQLFFGILGEYDPEYHELTTIRGTAKALTDMQIKRISTRKKNYWSPEVTFGTEYHYPGSLEILNQTIEGKTAREKLFNLAQYAIEHQESLDNLPVIVVRFLADDNLDDDKIEQIRTIWASLAQKDLLTFLRKYAVSTTFHNAARVKYWSSIERNLIIANGMTLKNRESYLGYYNPDNAIDDEGVEIFRPVYNVFGHQTGLEASDSPGIVKEAYNRSIDNYWMFTRNEDKQGKWQKNWAAVIPTADDATYRVKEVAEWIWNRFVADGLAHFGTLERAHVYALLGSGRDFSYFVDDSNPLIVYSEEDIGSDTVLQDLMLDMSVATINLAADDEDKRLTANFRVGLAVAFIAATPYVFAQEGI